MSVEKVKEYFEKYNKSNEILEFDVSSATVELAAKALNCDPDRIAKSLSFWVGETPIIIVTSGNSRINNSKYKAQFKTKAKMLAFEEVEQVIGHKVGGVCPFAVNNGVEVYLDVSLKKYTTVFPACGSSNSAIELTVDELEQYSGFNDWVDVCK